MKLRSKARAATGFLPFSLKIMTRGGKARYESLEGEADNGNIRKREAIDEAIEATRDEAAEKAMDEAVGGGKS